MTRIFALVAVAVSGAVLLCDLPKMASQPSQTFQLITRIEPIVTSMRHNVSGWPSSSWKPAIATVFWVGEGPTADNGFIANVKNAWDGEWQAHYGGVDDPHDRCGYWPCSFRPRENPFYIALPY